MKRKYDDQDLLQEGWCSLCSIKFYTLKYARVCILMPMNQPFTDVVGHQFYAGSLGTEQGSEPDFGKETNPTQ